MISETDPIPVLAYYPYPKTIRKTNCVAQPWAQLGGGHGEAFPNFFRQGGYHIPCPPHFFFRFHNILVSHQPFNLSPHILQQNCVHVHNIHFCTVPILPC